MGLSHEHVGSTIPAKINTYMLTRAELLITLCYETPCNLDEYYKVRKSSLAEVLIFNNYEMDLSFGLILEGIFAPTF